MKQVNFKKQAIEREALPTVLDQEFGISARLSIGLGESLNVEKLTIPKNREGLEIQYHQENDNGNKYSGLTETETGEDKEPMVLSAAAIEIEKKDEFHIVLFKGNGNFNIKGWKK